MKRAERLAQIPVWTLAITVQQRRNVALPRVAGGCDLGLGHARFQKVLNEGGPVHSAHGGSIIAFALNSVNRYRAKNEYHNRTKMKTTVAERLKESRKEVGLTQAELTKKARLKNQSIIGSLESGHRGTSSRLPAIAAALGVEPLWLAEGRGPKHAPSPLPGTGQLFEGSTDDPLLAAYHQASAMTRAAIDALLLPVAERKKLDSDTQVAIMALEMHAPIAMQERERKKVSRAA